MRHGRGWIVLVFLALGCGAPSISEGAGITGPVAVWTATPDGQPLSVPRVEVALRGHPARVMLDTGASQHFVLAAAAWAYDIRSEAFDALATDAHGTRFQVRLAEPGSMLIRGGAPPYAPPFIFLLDNDALLANGIVGGVSPQLLAPAGDAAVLDFLQGQLTVARRAALPRAATTGRVCRAGPDPRDGWRYVVPVRLGGRSAMLLVDTGAESTTLYDRSPLAAWLLHGRRTETVRVAGAASVVEMRLVDGVPVELGGASGEARVTIGPGHGQCGEDGLLGFDVLRRCRLAMHADGIDVACVTGEPPLHRAPPEPAREPLILARIDADDACGREGSDLVPVPDSPLPFRFESAIDAYATLAPEVRAHTARIEETCRGEGYLQARVLEPVLVREGGEARVRFRVDEGRRFTVQRVTVSVAGEDGRRELEPGAFPSLRTRPGQYYRRDDLIADARALADALVARGARVADAGFGRNENADATVDVHFIVALDGALPAAR